MTQGVSDRFGFVSIEGFNVRIGKLEAFEFYLDLAVDTILGMEKVAEFEVNQEQIQRELERKGHIHPSIVKRGEKYFFKGRPVHYWFNPSTEPLVVGYAGSGYEVDCEKVVEGRNVFDSKKGLVANIMEIVKSKEYNKDVLAHIDPNKIDPKDINAILLTHMLNVGGFTGHDLRGHERIGYTIEQKYKSEDKFSMGEHVLKVGLCRAYYPK